MVSYGLGRRDNSRRPYPNRLGASTRSNAARQSGQSACNQRVAVYTLELMRPLPVPRVFARWLALCALPLVSASCSPDTVDATPPVDGSSTNPSNPTSLPTNGETTADQSGAGSLTPSTTLEPSAGGSSDVRGPLSDTLSTANESTTASTHVSTSTPTTTAPSATMPDTDTTNGAPTSDPDVTALLSEFVVYWDFESGASIAVQPTLGVGTLTLEGAALRQGPSGQHVAFSATNASAASTDVEFDTSSSLSISAWVKLDAVGEFDTFVAVDGTAVSAVYLQKRSNDRLSFATFPSDDTGASPCVTTAEIKPRLDEWYHVVATRDADSGDQRLYVDGVLSANTRCPAGIFRATGAVSVGRGLYDGQPSDWIKGAVDELGLIQRVLSPAEVFRLYRAGKPTANHYLFAYFVEVAEGRGDGLRLAHSHDGLHWGAIGAGRVFMPPSVGGGSFRDPHLMRDPQGTYHLVWTTTCVPWAEANCVQDRGLGHATSSDLVQWSEADYIEIDLDVEHVWAPETFYDAATGQYLLFWSSPVDRNPSSSDPHDIYYLVTKDFKTFSEPSILYQRAGRNFIDATITTLADGGYLMILKDEADGQKNLRVLRSDTLFGAGAWATDPSLPLTGNYAAEGPSLLERNGELYIYFDKYGEGAYGALKATSNGDLTAPSAWQDISNSIFFPGVRHGTPIEVPWDVFERVAIEAGK